MIFQPCRPRNERDEYEYAVYNSVIFSRPLPGGFYLNAFIIIGLPRQRSAYMPASERERLNRDEMLGWRQVWSRRELLSNKKRSRILKSPRFPRARFTLENFWRAKIITVINCRSESAI